MGRGRRSREEDQGSVKGSSLQSYTRSWEVDQKWPGTAWSGAVREEGARGQRLMDWGQLGSPTISPFQRSGHQGLGEDSKT